MAGRIVAVVVARVFAALVVSVLIAGVERHAPVDLAPIRILLRIRRHTSRNGARYRARLRRLARPHALAAVDYSRAPIAGRDAFGIAAIGRFWPLSGGHAVIHTRHEPAGGS